MEIILQRAFPIFLKVDGKTRLIYTMAHTAAELLLQQEVVLGDADRVSLALTAAISNGSVVQVQRVTSALVQEDVDIPFKTIQKKDATLTQGRKTVKTEGKLGVMQKTYQVVYVDGIEESRELTEEKRLQEPVNSVVAIGTKPAPIIASRSGSGTTGRVYEGMASYYGSKFHGRKTAYGFIYDKNALTCAFPDRALRGKTLRVTYLKTGRSVNVVVNDLGPHTKGRLIDLSEAAARAIGLISAGVGKVKVEVLK
ncbi:MAG: septal ring lytic transglycosylase RlpA family protein [Firmicutes bacterium]|nr:septal ring lytic transglycosylase RlpA family protein [Bacillota bacterium]